MSEFRSLMDLTAAEWLTLLDLAAADVPDIVIVEGTWWRAQREAWRLGGLTDVRELGVPDLYWGRHGDTRVVYGVCYGAARTSETVHMLAAVGAKLVVQLGTCGGLQPHLAPGEVIVPDVAIVRDAVAPLYGAADTAVTDGAWLDRAQALLARQGLTTHRGVHLTWPVFFAETAAMVDGWTRAGYLGVDMETATTYAVARYFDAPAVAMLVVWDVLSHGRTVLDPLTNEEQAALDRGNSVVFDVALALAGTLSGSYAAG